MIYIFARAAIKGSIFCNPFARDRAEQNRRVTPFLPRAADFYWTWSRAGERNGLKHVDLWYRSNSILESRRSNHLRL
jgi:hypothetical protein